MVCRIITTVVGFLISLAEVIVTAKEGEKIFAFMAKALAAEIGNLFT